MRASGIHLGTVVIILCVVPIQHPFCYVPKYVEQAPRIWLLLLIGTAIQILNGNDSTTCQLQFRGFSPQFTLREGSTKTENQIVFTVNSADWQLVTTTGQQEFNSGYGILECAGAVGAQAVYSFFSADGRKIGEAAVIDLSLCH